MADNTADRQWVVRDAMGRPLHGLVQALRLGEYQRIMQELIDLMFLCTECKERKLSAGTLISVGGTGRGTCDYTTFQIGPFVCGKPNNTFCFLRLISSLLQEFLYCDDKDRHDKVLYQIVRAVATHNKLAMPDTLHWGQGQWTGQGTIAWKR